MPRPQANGTDASQADSDTPDAPLTAPTHDDHAPAPDTDDAHRDAVDTLAQAYIPTMLPSFAYAPPAEDLEVPRWVGAPAARRRRVAPEHDPRRVRTTEGQRGDDAGRVPPPPLVHPTPDAAPPRAVPNGVVHGDRRLPPRPVPRPPPLPVFAPVPRPNVPRRAAFLRRGPSAASMPMPTSTPASIPFGPPPGPLTFASLDARLRAPHGNTYLRVHSPAAARALVWTGTLASSGFSACAPAYAGLSPASYAAARAALGHGQDWTPGPYFADMAARHILAQPPAAEDGPSVWISATASLAWAVWAVARALNAGEREVRTAVIVPSGEVVLPASRFTLPLPAANRAKDAGEVLFFGRVFGASVVADLVWTPEALPFALPARFWKPASQRPLVGSWVDSLRFDPREPFERVQGWLNARGGEEWDEQPVHSFGHAWPPTSEVSGDTEDAGEEEVEELVVLSLSPPPAARELQTPLEPERCFLIW